MAQQKKTKLHEVIAVEGDLQKIATKVLEEAQTTFGKKADHFMGQITQLTMFDADRQREERREEKTMVGTVNEKLKYVSGHLTRYWDAMARKEATNQMAQADIVIDGEVLVAAVPGTLLLGMETRLKHVRQMIEAIPTLQPGIDWKIDESKGKDIYKSEGNKRFKTEKIPTSQVIVQATKEFPAQVNTWNRDVPVGEITDTFWCSMYSSADKSALLARLDKLLRAVKKARQRANEQEVRDLRIGKTLTDFIFNA